MSDVIIAKLKTICKSLLFNGRGADCKTLEDKTRVHDGRNYVPEEIEALWPYLTDRERHIVAIITNKIALNEEWG